MKIHRRTFLRAAGVAMALPLLDATRPRHARADAAGGVPRRMVCINTPLGLHPAHFFPEKAGRDYEPSPYLEVLKDFRDDFTVISGLSHPDVGPSHDSNQSFLTAAPHPERRAGFKNTISLDQFAAEHIYGQTRFPTLDAVLRRLRPFLDQERCARCRPRTGRRASSPGCSWKAAPTRCRPRPAAWPTGRASSTRSATRPGR